MPREYVTRLDRLEKFSKVNDEKKEFSNYCNVAYFTHH